MADDQRLRSDSDSDYAPIGNVGPTPGDMEERGENNHGAAEAEFDDDIDVSGTAVPAEARR